MLCRCQWFVFVLLVCFLFVVCLLFVCCLFDCAQPLEPGDHKPDPEPEPGDHKPEPEPEPGDHKPEPEPGDRELDITLILWVGPHHPRPHL